MAESSKIEWTDATFNPWIGCTKVSPGCDHCYAERSTPSRTLAVAWSPGAPRWRTSVRNWALPLRWEREHEAFFSEHGRRRRVFCASLADVFDNEVDLLWRRDLFKLISETPNLDWLLLTKRIGNVTRLIEQIADRPRLGSNAGDLLAHQWRNGNSPANLWLGATIVNQEEAERDVPKLLQVPARVRFLSIEPMLGPVYAEDIPDPGGGVCLKPLAGLRWIGDGQGRSEVRAAGGRIDWVICGGESGLHARPMHPEWVRSLRDQCASARVPFMFKQWGEWVPRGPVEWGYPIVEGVPRVRLTDTGGNGSNLGASGGNDVWMQRAGKKAAGRMLDGRTYDEFPRSTL